MRLFLMTTISQIEDTFKNKCYLSNFIDPINFKKDDDK